MEIQIDCVVVQNAPFMKAITRGHDDSDGERRKPTLKSAQNS